MRPEEPISVEITDDDAPSAVGVSVLLVESNFTCLAILSKILRAFGYKVITARRAADALSIVRAKENELDLILTETQLPDMDKYHLLESLGQISNLPIVIMSADNGNNAILGGFFKEAAFYLVKPLTMKDVKNIWQFAYMSKSEKKITVKVVSSGFHGETLLDDASGDDLKCVMRTGKQLGSLLGKRREEEDMDKENVEEDDSGVVKKKKKKVVVWKNELQDKFLQAVRVLGINDAHPKKILELMNVQGLKKEQVSSHLQKYRIYLKKLQVANQKTMRIDSPAESSSSRYLLSTYINRQEGFVASFKPQALASAYKPEFKSYFQETVNGGPISIPSHGSICLSNHVHSSRHEMSKFTYKQLNLQNLPPHNSRPDQFGFGIAAAMGKSSGYSQMGNYISEQLLKGSSPWCDAGSFGLSSIDPPTLFNNQQGQFLLQQPSSVRLQPSSMPPPSNEQEQEELGDKSCEVDELLEIANESCSFLLDKDLNNLW